MRPIVALAFLLLGLVSELFELSAASGGSVRVRGYMRKNGTYVAPHNRSAPNHTKSDNWSTRGNINPYTGQAGTRSVGGISTGSPFVEQRVAPAAVQPPFRPPNVAPQTTVHAGELPAQAAPNGEKGIQVIVGSGMYDERGADLDYQRTNAAKGRPELQYAMGIRFLKGIGVPRNEEAAVGYLRSADRSGHLRARAKLAELNSERRKMRDKEAAAADEEFARRWSSPSEK